MKLAVWGCFALLALLWTGVAALMAGLIGWAAQALASAGGAAGVVDVARAAAQWPVPEWIALWVDPQAVRFMQDAVQWGLGALGALGSGVGNGLPIAGELVGWLAPLVWVLWGLGMLGLLALALGAHWWIARRGPQRVA